MFNKMGRDKAPQPFVFRRLKGGKQAKPFVFTIITRGKKSFSLSPSQSRSSLFNQLDETEDVQSFIPSRMKRVFTLDVKTDGSLKVKRHALVITSCEVGSNSNGKVDDEEQFSSNHITIQETDNLKDEVEPATAPKALKDGGKL